jgi:hypothetical protein
MTGIVFDHVWVERDPGLSSDAQVLGTDTHRIVGFFSALWTGVLSKWRTWRGWKMVFDFGETVHEKHALGAES